MRPGLVAKISIGLNIVLIPVVLIAWRRHFTHTDQAMPAPSSSYFDKWNQARQSILGPLSIDTTDVVFVGNSITEGFPLQEMFHSLKIKNRGIGGNRSYHIRGRIETIARARPAKIFLDVGINDILNKVPLDTLKLNYESILHLIWNVSPKTKIYVQSVFPVGKSHANEQKTVEVFNKWLMDFCSRANIPYIDLFSSFYKDGFMNPVYTCDDIHLNGVGYEVWKARVQPYL